MKRSTLEKFNAPFDLVEPRDDCVSVVNVDKKLFTALISPQAYDNMEPLTIPDGHLFELKRFNHGVDADYTPTGLVGLISANKEIGEFGLYSTEMKLYHSKVYGFVAIATSDVTPSTLDIIKNGFNIDTPTLGKTFRPYQFPDIEKLLKDQSAEGRPFNLPYGAVVNSGCSTAWNRLMAVADLYRTKLFGRDPSKIDTKRILSYPDISVAWAKDVRKERWIELEQTNGFKESTAFDSYDKLFLQNVAALPIPNL